MKKSLLKFEKFKSLYVENYNKYVTIKNKAIFLDKKFNSCFKNEDFKLFINVLIDKTFDYKKPMSNNKWVELNNFLEKSNQGSKIKIYDDIIILNDRMQYIVYKEESIDKE